MRLRKLKLPIAYLHPQEMHTVQSFDEFDNNSTEEVLRGYHDDTKIIDSNGVEYSVENVFLTPKKWWRKIGLFSDRSADVDMELYTVAKYSATELCKRLIEYVEQHPDWHWAGEGQWVASEVAARFSNAQTPADVIEKIGNYAVETYEPMPPGRSSKVIDFREGPLHA